jgi:hypothetical protein
MCESIDCVCREAVATAYRELRQRNVSEVSAFETAARLLRIHHPEIGPRAARERTAAILDAQTTRH